MSNRSCSHSSCKLERDRQTDRQTAQQTDRDRQTDRQPAQLGVIKAKCSNVTGSGLRRTVSHTTPLNLDREGKLQGVCTYLYVLSEHARTIFSQRLCFNFLPPCPSPLPLPVLPVPLSHSGPLSRRSYENTLCCPSLNAMYFAARC